MNDKWCVLHLTEGPLSAECNVRTLGEPQSGRADRTDLRVPCSFVRCITKPGPALTPNDEACLMRCTDRFLEVRPASDSLPCLFLVG